MRVFLTFIVCCALFPFVATAEQLETDSTIGDYHVVTLHDSQYPRLFEIQSIEADANGVTIYLFMHYPDDTRFKILSGELTAESSRGDTSESAPIQYYRRCHCNSGAVIVVDMLSETPQSCYDCCGADGSSNTVYYFYIGVIIGDGLDLGISWDPNSLYLFER